MKNDRFRAMKRRFEMKNTILTLMTLFVFVKIAFAPVGSAENNLPPDYHEPPIEQAKKLLRKVRMMGTVSYDVPVFDSAFANNVGQPCQLTRDQLRSYITRQNINEWEIGGSIDAPVSSVSDSTNGVTYARYFVIHDTSFPRYGSKGFPANIDDASWEWNNLNKWNAPVCHIYVNRVGQSKTMTPFDGGMTATKMERYILGETSSRGLYLHIELVQPRRFLKGYGRGNDVDAPDNGFTTPQYRRLALLYITASVRKGEWLIPGFHACVDQGIRNAHDDPQNFELERFMSALRELIGEVGKV